MKKVRLAWAAGFIDGEGCFWARNRTIGLSVYQSSPELLEKLQSIIGGKLYGPYQPTGLQKKPRWVLKLNRNACQAMIDGLWPYLGKVKRQQWNESVAQATAKQI